MPLLRIADLETRADDHGAPFEEMERVNDELSGTPYSIVHESSRKGYSYFLVMEEEE